MNRIVKFTLALSIPGLLVWGFLGAKKDAERQIKDFKQEQSAKPQSDSVVINGYELKEVDDQNQLRWQLKAKRGTIAAKSHLVNLEGIIVEYFNGPEIKMRLTAPTGEANEENKYVKLSRQNGQRVICEGDGGKTHMETSILELSKNNRFIASDGVNINLPGVAKISGDRAEGNINFSELNNFKIIGNTHAQIVVN